MENNHFQWVNPLFPWPCWIATLNYQKVTACSSIFPCDPLRPCHRAVVPRYGALGVMNDFRGVTSAYGYGDSYLVTWRFRAWTLATKQKFMDFLYGFYMVLPCLHVILSLPVLCYCFWYVIYKFVCLNLFDVVCSAIPGPWLQLDTGNLLLQLGLQCGLTGQTWYYSMDYYIVTQKERNTWFITILVWFYFSMCVCVLL